MPPFPAHAFDLPPERLTSYSGTNPKPEDFEEYWNATLEEVDALPDQVNIQKADFQVPGVQCYELVFQGIGEASVYAKFIRPEKPHPDGNPGILHFHGYSISSPQWMELYRYAALGFYVVAMDCRGQGGRSEDSGATHRNTLQGHMVRGIFEDPKHLRFRAIFSDTYRLAKILATMPEVDETRLAAMGGSQGGGLSLACSALYPEIAQVLISFPFLCDYQRVWELGLSEEGAYREIGELVRRADPRGERLDTLFHNLGYVDVAHLAPRIRATCLMGVGLADRICPPSTQFAAYNRLQGEKEYVLYPLHAHETLPGFEDLASGFYTRLLSS